MLEFRKVEKEDNALGYSFIFLWIISVTWSYNIVRGDHITLGFGIGPFEVSVCLSIWRKLLP
tara:strand:+ start:5308 stop:5493 length:186 start_codon:yes stop_codon:yes gene_type:complete